MSPPLLLGLIVVVAAIVRLHGLGEASLWLDEAASVKFAGLPWSTLWLSGYDNAPPVYYSLLKLVLLFGDSELAVRLPSMVFGVLTIPVVYRTGQLVAGSRAGLGASLFFALSATQVEYSQEARAYSLLVFALAVALLGLLLFLRKAPLQQDVAGSLDVQRQRMLGLKIYTAGILLALYTHNIAVFFVFLSQLAFAYHCVTCGARRLSLIRYWLVANGLVFLLWLPWLHIILTELVGNGSMAWLQHIGFARAFGILRDVNGFAFVWRGQPWQPWLDLMLDLVLGLICLLGAYSLRRQPSVLLTLLLVGLCGPLLIWSLGYLQPMYMERSIVWGFLATTLLFGAGVNAMKQGGRLMALMFLAAISGWSLMSFHELGATENEDWQTGFAAWRQQAIPQSAGQAALFCSPEAAIPMVYYARHEIELPPTFAWGASKGGFGAAFLLQGARAASDAGHPDWLAQLPHDLFLWKRGYADVGRRLLPELPDQSLWRQATWHRLEVIYSHCLEDSKSALQAALKEAGWGLRESTDFKGGRFASYACGRMGCYLPGLANGLVAEPALSPRE